MIRTVCEINGQHKYVSILVLLELPFDQGDQIWYSLMATFQSLFYWNCRLIPERPGIFSMEKNSFNPCFIGIAVWSRIDRWRHEQRRYVSILVLLELPFDLFFTEKCASPIWVSILVLLELPFDRSWFCSASGFSGGFNPCFIGIAVWSTLRWTSLITLRGFNPCFIGIAVWSLCLFYEAVCVGVSILVLLELPFDLLPSPEGSTGTGFNPCFIGIAVWSCYQDMEPSERSIVSILVLLELPFDRLIIRRGRKERIVSILVLLELPFDQRIYRPVQQYQRVSILVLLELPFDPCCTPRLAAMFLGVSILVLLELPFDRHFRVSLDEFFWVVSILVLLELPFDLLMPVPNTTPTLMFQSLFYWNCRLITFFTIVPIRANMGFNPCFIGIAVWSFRSGGLPGMVGWVSILVLLELPFDLNLNVDSNNATNGFNPCFIGIAVWSPAAAWDKFDQLLFQSLFYWNCRLIR